MYELLFKDNTYIPIDIVNIITDYASMSPLSILWNKTKRTNTHKNSNIRYKRVKYNAHSI
jgi:hypothetical protein